MSRAAASRVQGNAASQLMCMGHESHPRLLFLGANIRAESATPRVLAVLMNQPSSHPIHWLPSAISKKATPSQHGSGFGGAFCIQSCCQVTGGHPQAQQPVSGDRPCSPGVTRVTLVLRQHRGLGVFSSSQQKAKVRARRLS